MDTVKGSRDAGKCLMTLLFRNSSFMLIFLLPSCTQKAVSDVFDWLYEILGRRTFMKTFRIILTDNGPEFKDPWSIEQDKNGKQRTKVFYCDPYASNQKVVWRKVMNLSVTSFQKDGVCTPCHRRMPL
ncbi:MAG: hypothetical protein ACLRR3_10345 [Eubacterium sp.]